MADTAMRLDKFLWFVRIVQSRSAAQTLAEEGRMRLDGRIVDRAHSLVRRGSVLTFALHGRVRVIRINALPARRGPPAEATLCISDMSPTVDAEPHAK